MAATETTGTKRGTTFNSCVPHTIPFDQINEPGCYVCNWSGHLLRVPQDALAPGRSPVMNMVGYEPLFVTKICDDPFVPITKAKILACNCDVCVNF